MVLRNFASFIFAKKCEISRKSLLNANENFRIFSRNVTFAGNPNPVPVVGTHGRLQECSELKYHFPEIKLSQWTTRSTNIFTQKFCILTMVDGLKNAKQLVPKE